MTPLMLQDALVEELGQLLDGHLYKTTEGALVPLNVYAQEVPVNPLDDDADPVPYAIVRLLSGAYPGASENGRKTEPVNTVKLAVIISVWDDDQEAQRHREVMNIIQNIYERFEKNPCLDRQFVYAGKFEWALQEDTYYPYSFGVCTMTFNIPAIRREDPFI